MKTLLNNKTPPKNGDFLGLVDHQTPYWDIFFYGRKEDGLRKAEFVDRGLFSMPKLRGWVELPDIEGV